MMQGFVMSAPSQWKKSRISCPASPGKRYLLPPEKPTTSCGNTGPMMIRWSYSSAIRLTGTFTRIRSIPAERRPVSSSESSPTTAS